MAEQVETQKNKSPLSCNAVEMVPVCPMFGLCGYTSTEGFFSGDSRSVGILNPLINVWSPVALDFLVKFSSASGEGGVR